MGVLTEFGDGTGSLVLLGGEVFLNSKVYSKLKDAPGGRAAVDVFRTTQLARLHDVVDRTLAMDRPEGSGVFATSDHAIKLTDEEAHELRQEIADVVESWTERTRGREPGRRTYRLVQIIQPHAEGDATGE